MNRETNKLLFDIHNAILKIEQYLTGSKKFEDYQNNPMLQQAVERNIEIIGEAVNSLLKIDLNLPLSNARKIVNTRNKLIHGYDDIENSEIWAIIIKHIPILKEEVEKLIK